jgi:trk system potassium uptake protein TrkH
VSKVLSPLTAIVSLSMLWPLAWALRDGGTDVRAFATAVAVGLGLSAALFLWGRGADYADLDVKDGFGVVALMWLAASLLGALPGLHRRRARARSEVRPCGRCPA